MKTKPKKLKVGQWVVHPVLALRGNITHVYDSELDPAPNSQGRLIEIDYCAIPGIPSNGTEKVNQREGNLKLSKDQTSGWAEKRYEDT